MAKYNVHKTQKLVDTEVDSRARRLIWDCQHLTPKTSAEMDNLLGLPKSRCGDEPDQELLPSFDDECWMDDEPTDAALRAIDAE